MTWYAAHIIMAVKLTEHKQSRFPVWENIVLIEANSEDDAFAKAEEHGKREEGDCDGSFHWEGRPATWVFAGVRKLVECALMGNRPADGDEVSYTELEVDSFKAVEELALGKKVDVGYRDIFRAQKRQPKSERQKGEKRKGA